jgi:hypothetical protein
VRVLPRITYADARWGTTLRDKTKQIAAFFKQEFAAFKEEMEDTSYLKHRVLPIMCSKGLFWSGISK